MAPVLSSSCPTIEGTMLAVRALNQSGEFAIETIDIPKLGIHDVLVKIEASSVTAGIRRVARLGLCKLPSTIGHEGAGTVVAIGSEVPPRIWHIGDRVRVHPIMSCRNCIRCTKGRDHMCAEQAAAVGFGRYTRSTPLYDQYPDGCLAEYARLPYWLLDHIPPGVSFAVAAKVHDVATALQVLQQAHIPDAATVLVTAPTGNIGSLVLRLAELFPIKKLVLVGRNETRLRAAAKITQLETRFVVLPAGCSSGVDGDALSLSTSSSVPSNLTSEIKALAPEGIDVILDLLSTPQHTVEILHALRIGGTFVHLGANLSALAMPLIMIMQMCWTIVGCRTNGRAETNQALEWLGDGSLRIDDLITHRFKFKEVLAAFEVVEARQEPMWLNVVELS